MPEKRQPTMEPPEEEVDHVLGPSAARVLVEYGDYECPYSRQAFRAIERVERELTGGVRFAFRPFPLTDIHPHALAGRRRGSRAPIPLLGDAQLLFIAREGSKTTTCGAIPPSSTSTSSSSPKTGPTRASRGGSGGTSRADWHPARCAAHRRCSSTRRAPRRLRRGDPAGSIGPMSAICSHTDSITLTKLPDQIAGCTDCLAIGGTWVHLRMCQSCGHIACCDSSPNRHASAHARGSGHPIIRSAEPGENWSWCYLDNVAFVVSGR